MTDSIATKPQPSDKNTLNMKLQNHNCFFIMVLTCVVSKLTKYFIFVHQWQLYDLDKWNSEFNKLGNIAY